MLHCGFNLASDVKEELVNNSGIIRLEDDGASYLAQDIERELGPSLPRAFLDLGRNAKDGGDPRNLARYILDRIDNLPGADVTNVPRDLRREMQKALLVQDDYEFL
jgi:hypothetical protein